MKKLFLSLCAIMAISFTFAQKSNVSKAENLIMQETPDFKGAREAIKAAMQDESTKNDAKTYYIAGLIGQKENEEFVKLMMLKKDVDQMQKGKAIMESVKYFMIADSLDQLPNAKGKVKPRYTTKIKEALKDYYSQQYNLISYGATLYDNKNYENAYKTFNTYLNVPKLPMLNNELKVDSTYKMIKYYTAASASNSGNHNEAIKLYTELKSDDYQTKNVYQLLASEYLTEKDTVSYLQTLNEGFNKFKDEPWFLQNIINHYIYTNQIEKASKYLDDAIAQSPNTPQYYSVKGNIEDRLGNMEAARAAFEKALSLEPNSAEAYGGIGRIIFNQGVQILNNAINIKDNKLYQAEKEKADNLFKASMPYLKKAVELNPKDNDYKFALKQLYYRLNMQKEYDEISKEME
ncbi:Tetratricopeptide TPR_1 repeat-containing protein [uncultured Paludibacter sp.]|uniref:Tetratricopeptide TPR_1 repeat-containing protein n=1 Tax=uncultured Paludibacter sp. TaxID=497635 RepID=A0A653ACF7_9BACT|nr:Tetratricopeptide TPR_1 repeat-containing protein [uncultured Paludibacter sp.]